MRIQTMGTLRFIFGDQLTLDLASLRGIDPTSDIVLMAEVGGESSIVGFHKQKLVLIYSAMRHFAESLRVIGIAVDYIRLDDPENTQSLTGELVRAIARHEPECVIVTEPGAYRVLSDIQAWAERFQRPVIIREDDRFICSREEFAYWADRKTYRMEFFYRAMRQKTGYLMGAKGPLAEQWNFDADNRGSLPEGHRPLRRLRFEPDPTTLEVIDLVTDRYGNNFGEIGPFGWAVTREQALAALAHFVDEALPNFGRYQDAMQTGAPFLYHAILSPYLNIGLLTAREVCEAALAAFETGSVPLNAVEGFIRQIIGWREYVRGIYWLKMPAYAQSNVLGAHRPLPWFYWSRNTDLNCMKQVIAETHQNAYAHHIQRLMVTGNFALLVGVEPSQIEAWYLSVYIDAFDWVELPNTHGMVMFADGGLLASKPYAASGAYINRMSDYCKGCSYNPKIRSGPRACPFNMLYWNFLDENKARLRSNPRMSLPYKNLERLEPAELAAIKQQALTFLSGLYDKEAKHTAPEAEQMSLDL